MKESRIAVSKEEIDLFQIPIIRRSTVVYHSFLII